MLPRDRRSILIRAERPKLAGPAVPPPTAHGRRPAQKRGSAPPPPRCSVSRPTAVRRFSFGLPCVHFSGRSRPAPRSEEHTSELQSLRHIVCRLLLEKKKQ